MPVQITVENNKIKLFILSGTKRFSDIVSACKKNHCIYSIDTNKWDIPISKYTNVVDDLEEVDRILCSTDTDELIEALVKPPIICTKTNIIVGSDDLKVGHKKGKKPHEDFQLDDLKRAVSYNYHGLLQEQGCGKSWLISSIITLLDKYKGSNKIVVITSSSGVLNIAKEIVKFTYIKEDDISIGGIHNRKPFNDISKKVIICNYRSFLLISDEYQKGSKINPNSKNYRKTPIPIDDWLDDKEGIFFLDESHNIGNPSSRQTKAILALSTYFKYKYIASGTPADEESKYYAQLKFMHNSLVHNMSFSDWKNYYCELGSSYSEYDIKCFKPEKLRELVKIVKDHTTRRFAEDVLDIPPNTIKKIYIDYTLELQDLYQAYIIDELRKLQTKSEGAVSADGLKSNFMKLTSIVDDPAILLNSGDLSSIMTKMVNKFNFMKHHPKIEALLDLIEKHKNEKIVIWTSRPSVGDKLNEKFKEVSLVINGGTTVPKGMTLDELKDKIVQEFRTSKTKNILISGIQVLNSAVTATEATVNIYFDTGTNYTQFYQSMKRIHRIGQDKPVTTYILLIDKSIDVVRYSNIEDRDFINKFFGSEKYLNMKSVQQFFTMAGAL